MTELPIALNHKDLLGILLLFLGTGITTVLLMMWPRARDFALFAIVAGVALVPWIDLDIYSAYWYRGTTRGFEVTAVDVLVWGLLLSVLLSPGPGRSRWYWPASLGAMLVFVGYCVAATIGATPSIFGWFEVSKMIRGIAFFLVAALYVRSSRELGIVVLALAAISCLETAHALRERLLQHIWRPEGTLQHANSLSMYTCLVTPVLVAAACSSLSVWIRRACWVAVAGACVTMVLTLSRAGLPVFVLTAGAALLWCASWRPTLGKAVIATVATVAILAIVAKSWNLIIARYESATLEQEYFDAPGESRGYYFRQAAVILDNRPFGVGLNNWSYWVSREYGAPLGMRYERYDDLSFAPPSDILPQFRFAAPAHNLGVLTVGELGWAGLALLGILWLRWLVLASNFLFSRSADPYRRVAIGIFFGLIGVLLQSFTEWTYRQTTIYLTLHFLVGAMAAMQAQRRVETRESAYDEDIIEEEGWLDAPEPVPAHVRAPAR